MEKKTTVLDSKNSPLANLDPTGYRVRSSFVKNVLLNSPPINYFADNPLLNSSFSTPYTQFQREFLRKVNIPPSSNLQSVDVVGSQKKPNFFRDLLEPVRNFLGIQIPVPIDVYKAKSYPEILFAESKNEFIGKYGKRYGEPVNEAAFELSGGNPAELIDKFDEVRGQHEYETMLLNPELLREYRPFSRIGRMNKNFGHSNNIWNVETKLKVAGVTKIGQQYEKKEFHGDLLNFLGGVDLEDDNSPKSYLNLKISEPDIEESIKKDLEFFDLGGGIYWQSLEKSSTYPDYLPIAIVDIIDKKAYYFRAYLTGLKDSINPTWNSYKYIGNPMDYYTYSGISRKISFTLTLYPSTEYELETIWRRARDMARLIAPRFNKIGLYSGSFVKLTIGDLYKNEFGFFESIDFSFMENGSWEVFADERQSKHKNKRMKSKVPFGLTMNFSFVWIGEEILSNESSFFSTQLNLYEKENL